MPQSVQISLIVILESGLFSMCLFREAAIACMVFSDASECFISDTS